MPVQAYTFVVAAREGGHRQIVTVHADSYERAKELAIAHYTGPGQPQVKRYRITNAERKAGVTG